MDGSRSPRCDARLEPLRAAVTLLAIFTAGTIAYTLALCAAATVVGPVKRDDILLRPSVAATFAGPQWFHGRPSAATGDVSGGSNLGPTNPAFAAAVAVRATAIRAEHAAHEGPVPIDLVTTSASGLDPHVSPAAARLQVARVAAATGLAPDTVRDLVERSIEPRTIGIFGQPRVNVIRLNASLHSLVTCRSKTAGAP